MPGQPDQGRGGLRPAVLARYRPQRAGVADFGPATIFDNTPPDGSRRRALRLHRRLPHAPWAKLPPTSGARRCWRTSPSRGDEARAAGRYIEQDWTNERWTRGCPVGHFAPGVLRGRAVAAPRRRQGLFAGTETSDSGWATWTARCARASGRPGGPRGAAALIPALPPAHLLPGAPALDFASPRAAPAHRPWRGAAGGPALPAAPTLAFGRLDALRPGFAEAGHAARDAGFEPIVRLAGGHAPPTTSSR